MRHICVNKVTIIGSDNGLSLGRRQAIIWSNAGKLLIGHLETNFSEIVIKIQTFSFRKMRLKMSSGKWLSFVSASMCWIEKPRTLIHYPQAGCSMPGLRWRHNGHDGVSNHQPHDCLLNHLFRHRSKKTSKLRVTGLCAGDSPGTGEFPAQMASNAENVSIWWRHHGKILFVKNVFGLPCGNVLSVALVSGPWWHPDWTGIAHRLVSCTYRGYICSPHRGLQIIGGWLQLEAPTEGHTYISVRPVATR